MAVIWTIEERCKRCYTCIRECPAKAIKVEHGQAKVVEHRCVACGHCVRVCSQNAKAVLDGVTNTMRFLEEDSQVVAMLAPSFPASFPDIPPEKIVGALRKAGFKRIVEVAFGADLINLEYKKLAEKTSNDQDHRQKRPVITSSCPAIFKYIEKYAPELIDNLAPIVSPMIAMGRVVRHQYSVNTRVVFIGPCAAKKVEIRDSEVQDAVDEVLTFKELETLWQELDIVPGGVDESWFDPPFPFLGRIYPISGGLVRSAGMAFDLMDNDIIMTEGKHRIMNLLDCIKNNEIKTNIADMLFCEGCINGPFMSHSANHFTRKQKIVEYAESHRVKTNHADWEKAIETFRQVNIHRAFESRTIPSPEPGEEDILRIFHQIGKFSPSDELNCGACGYESCRDYAHAVYEGLAEEEMCLPYLIDKHEKTQRQLRQSLQELADTQEQLIHSEKLASIGQLAAGVAHEVNNPLGSILLFSHLLLKQAGDDNPGTRDLKFIIDEANRCRTIVSGLLNFARQGRLNLRSYRIQNVLEKLVKVIEKQTLFGKIELELHVDPELPEFDIDPDQIYQVFVNIAQNAAEAMPDGGKLVITAGIDKQFREICVEFQDTGSGISQENMKKLFTPFFTTKQIGKGTGLGLPIAYGIVKMHKGNIRVKSEVGKGTIFYIDLPLQARINPRPAIMD